MPVPPSSDRLRLCVVQLDGVLHARTPSDLWLPAEPLLDPDSGNCASDVGLSVAKLFANGANHVYKEVQEVCTTATNACLSEVLDFLNSHAPDVVVFPEYQVPISYLPELVAFSQGRAVVAGLGYVRGSREATELAQADTDGSWSVDELVGHNVSVLVEHGRVHLVTKLNKADGEVADGGRGHLVLELTLRGRQVRVAVAVCLDYLLLDGEIATRKVEIVCIPANSRQVKPFLPDEARDHVRLLANCAVYGGSQVVMPALSGALTTRLGVEPLAAGYRGMIMVEFDGFPNRPSALVGPSNSLVLRAEMIERGPDNEPVLAFINELIEAGSSNSENLMDQVATMLDRVGVSGPFAQALRAYHNALIQGFDGKELLDLARTHLAVTHGGRRDTIRGQQARHVLAKLPELEASNRTAPVGSAADVYRGLAEQLCPITMGSVLVQENDAVVEPQDEPRHERRPGGLVQFTRTTARDGTRSEKLEIYDPALAREFLAKMRIDLPKDM